MRSHDPRSLLVMFTFEDEADDSSTLRRVDSLLDRCESYASLNDVPLHWCVSGRILEHPPSRDAMETVGRLGTRVATGGDIIVSAGYSGIPHPALLPDDVSLDLAWAASGSGHNEDTGAVEGLAHLASAICPSYPDLRRASVREMYRRTTKPLMLRSRGLVELIIPGTDAQSTPDSILCSWVDSRTLSTHRPERTVNRTAVPGRVVLQLPGSMAIHDIASGEFAERIDRLARRGGYRPVLIDWMLRDRSRPEPTVQVGGPVPPERPLTRSELTMLGTCSYTREELNRSARRNRSEATEPADILDSRGFRERAHRLREIRSHAASSNRHDDERILVADMTGNTVMVGDRVSASFEHGRLAELSREGASIQLATPAESWITVLGKRFTFRLESAFSFEEEHARGLQERFQCETPVFDFPLELDTDVFFVDDAPFLFVFLNLVFPPTKSTASVGPFHPFDLSIHLPPSTGMLCGRYPNGETMQVPMTRTEDNGFAWGTNFEVTAGIMSLILFSPEGVLTRMAQLPYRTRLRRRLAQLTMGIGGFDSVAPAAAWAGDTITSLYGIDLAQSGSSRLPTLSVEASRHLKDIIARRTVPFQPERAQ